MKIRRPKFKVGDVVWMRDKFHFNPCYDTISIGRIQSIHIHRGSKFIRSERFHGKRITYRVTGFSLMPNEEQLSLYTDQEFETTRVWEKESTDAKS